VWHRATIGGSLEEFEDIWIWAKESDLNPNELLVNQIVNNFAVFQLTAHGNQIYIYIYIYIYTHVYMCVDLCDWANKAQ